MPAAPKFEFESNRTTYSPLNAFWLARASQLAYNNKSTVKRITGNWGFSKFQFYNNKNTDTQAFMIANDDTMILSFRGTQPTEITDWLTDLRIRLTRGPGGRVHKGFMTALHSVWEEIEADIHNWKEEQPSRNLWITGHSLGAALSTLAVAYLMEMDVIPVYGLYNYGSPRVGDKDFEIYMHTIKERMFRFVNNNDVVTRVPPRFLDYRHVGTLRYFDSEGNLYQDVSWWYKMLDDFRGRIFNAFKQGIDDLDDKELRLYITDGIEDHAIGNYIDNVRKNMNHPGPLDFAP
jgi:triacylglycerol lipase